MDRHKCEGRPPRRRRDGNRRGPAGLPLGGISSKPVSARRSARSTWRSSRAHRCRIELGQLLGQSHGRLDRTPRARNLDQVAERRFAQRTARSGQQQLGEAMHRVQRRARIVHQEPDQLVWTGDPTGHSGWLIRITGAPASVADPHPVPAMANMRQRSGDPAVARRGTTPHTGGCATASACVSLSLAEGK